MGLLNLYELPEEATKTQDEERINIVSPKLAAGALCAWEDGLILKGRKAPPE